MKKKKFKYLTSGLLIVVMCFVVQFGALAYDQSGAIAYADQYCTSPNSDYRFFDDTDCANFVSQCMHEGGGLPMNSGGVDWEYNQTFLHLFDTWSLSWSVAHNLLHYLEDDLNAPKVGQLGKKQPEL